jgi:hypothetical protein
MTGPPIREAPPELDCDMRPGDIVTELQRLKFNGDKFKAIRVDRDVRDFLVNTLSARQPRRA